MALVVLSVVEQRLDAVREVLAGADVVEVADRCGVHRSTVHRWGGRHLVGQLSGLADRSHRPHGCPHQVSAEVEAAVAEMRRKHPRWGSRRIRLEMLRRPVAGVVVPAERTIDRALVRRGCCELWLPPAPDAELLTEEQRGASNTAVIMVAGQKVALGREHAGRTVTVHVTETTLAIERPENRHPCRAPHHRSARA
jgi:transposase